MYEPMLRGLGEMGAPGVLLSGSRDEGAVLGSVTMERLPVGRGRLVHGA
jgi:DNA segregation ATPase FtsK/SpoIIIE, S-DNA-T family